MSPTTFNFRFPTVRRILKEVSELSSNPDPTIHAASQETDLFDWHFTIQGPPATPYSDGAYHGRIILPQQYPLRPPMFRFLTPSGRFEVNREICLSISGHHEEPWQPAWGIRTALAALRVLMEGGSKGQVGGMEMPDRERRRLAEESRSWKCSSCDAGVNQEILDPQKEEAEKGGCRSKIKEIIPEELRLEFKDEMSMPTPEARPDSEKVPKTSQSSAVLGFQGTKAPPSNTEITNSRPRPAQDCQRDEPDAWGRLSNATAPQSQHSFPIVPVVTGQNGVPTWIDKLIVILIATLSIMIIRKVFA